MSETADRFRPARRAILRAAHAADGLYSATRHAEKLLETWGQDVQVTAALHTAMVVDYSRAFEERPAYAHRHLRVNPMFKQELHTQLLNLRHKLIAHSDSRYTVNELGIVLAKIGHPDFVLSIPHKGIVRLSALHSIDSKELADKYLSHVRAAAEGTVSDIHRHMEKYLRDGAEDPLEFSKSQPSAADKEVKTISFGSVKSGDTIQLPRTDEMIAPMDEPKLAIGLDGLLYRTMGLVTTLHGSVEVETSAGALKIELGPRKRTEDQE